MSREGNQALNYFKVRKVHASTTWNGCSVCV